MPQSRVPFLSGIPAAAFASEAAAPEPASDSAEAGSAKAVAPSTVAVAAASAMAPPLERVRSVRELTVMVRILS